MAEYMTIEVLKQYSPVDERKIGRLLNEEINKSQIKFVVLDDDLPGYRLFMIFRYLQTGQKPV